jgi:large conductance mechanosensitive channel
VIDFTLIALVIFFAVKAINRLRRQEQAAPPAPAPAEPSAEAKLLAEIRDLLSKR